MIDIAPLTRRLNAEWQREADVTVGLRHPNMLIFYAVNVAGAVERRRRWFRRGWWLRFRQR